MNRDELLTKLAMELGEWPLNASQAREMMPDGWYWRGDDGAIHVGGGVESFAITAPDWLQRRAELINKPSWDDAPAWAQWLAQDEDGEWRAFKNFPKTGPDHWFSSERISKGKMSKGTIPAGHDWRETLEARPAFDESRADAIGQNGPTGDHYMTEEEEELPAQEKHDCPRCGGCFYSPPHDACPCPGNVSDGSTASYYVLPEGATEIQDLISYRNMNHFDAMLLILCYDHAKSSSDHEKLILAREMEYYARREVRRLEGMHTMQD